MKIRTHLLAKVILLCLIVACMMALTKACNPGAEAACEALGLVYCTYSPAGEDCYDPSTHKCVAEGIVPICDNGKSLCSYTPPGSGVPQVDCYFPSLALKLDCHPSYGVVVHCDSPLSLCVINPANDGLVFQSICYSADTHFCDPTRGLQSIIVEESIDIEYSGIEYADSSSQPEIVLGSSSLPTPPNESSPHGEETSSLVPLETAIFTEESSSPPEITGRSSSIRHVEESSGQNQAEPSGGAIEPSHSIGSPYYPSSSSPLVLPSEINGESSNQQEMSASPPEITGRSSSIQNVQESSNQNNAESSENNVGSLHTSSSATVSPSETIGESSKQPEIVESAPQQTTQASSSSKVIVKPSSPHNEHETSFPVSSSPSRTPLSITTMIGVTMTTFILITFF